MSKLYNGVDVSLYQNCDFARAKESGVDFVMIKAGQGRIPGEYNQPFTDPKFHEHMSKAQSAGMPVGTYWYFTANTEEATKAEAKYYVSLLKQYEPWKHRLWAAIDVEDDCITANYNELTRLVKLFCDIGREAGYRPMVYANSWWLDSKFSSPAGVPIWEANWGIDNFPTRARMWQYSDRGNVPGIGVCDVNHAYDIMGDADGDGKVSARDAITVLRRAAGWKNSVDEAQADMNGDGYVNAADAVQILRDVAE